MTSLPSALLMTAVLLVSCASEAETTDAPVRPAPVSFSDLPGADEGSPLAIESVERRLDQGVGVLLTAFRGQRLTWRGRVLLRMGSRLVVGVRTVRIEMRLEGESEIAPGDDVTVRGVVDRIDPGSRTTFLMAEASAAPVR
jgi:hypothetical protein